MPKDYADKPEITLVSLIPNLVGGEGHVYPYHQSVSQATTLLGWKHLAAVAPDPAFSELPGNWSPCLSGGNLELEGNLIQKVFRIKSAFTLGITIANYLRLAVIPNSDYTIIFMERFIHLQLFALTIALLLLPRKNLFVWLLYRRDTHKAKTGFIYKLLNNIIKQLLYPSKFQILTDSEFLSKSLSNYFKTPVAVMPIPHTDVVCSERFLGQNDEILCWWPGPPRPEKGLETMKSFVNFVSEGANRLCVVAAESSGLVSVKGGVRVQLIQDNLTRLEYSKWLCTCDVVLMPYDSEAYSERTSGIFTECIIAVKIPVVTKNTWMAKELSKYNLEELVIDWQETETIVPEILRLSKDPTVKAKVAKMQKQYEQFHNIESYAQKMNWLFTHSSRTNLNEPSLEATECSKL